MLTQILPTRYYELHELTLLLEKLFGQNFKASFMNERYVLLIPRELTRAEIKSCEAYHDHLHKRTPAVPSSGSSGMSNIVSPKLELSDSLDQPNQELPIQEIKLLDGKFIILPDSPQDGNDSKLTSSTIIFSPQSSISHNAPSISGYLHEAGVISKGITCKVYAVVGSLVYDTSPDETSNFTTKIAVKRLLKGTSKVHFLQEYEILNTIRRGMHPNIVQILRACFDVTDGDIIYNFLFPLAAGNLKQLFSNELVAPFNTSVMSTLWHQFEGLGSAVEFLHNNGIVHRDIKPSNILLYEDNLTGGLITKIADFGLSIGSKNAPKFEFGTLEAKSAFKYDAPEVKMHAQAQGIDSEDGVAATISQLCQADIWKLAAVFSELLSHLVCGPGGVQQFRTFITTTQDKITSDSLSDIAYDDGEKVKDEVLYWLEKLAERDVKAREIGPLITAMFGEAKGRPSATVVTKTLREASFCLYTDVTRIIRFTYPKFVQKPLWIDTWKQAIEKFLGEGVNWRPFSQPLTICPDYCTRISWQWNGEELSIDLPHEVAKRYKKKCVPISSIPQQQFPQPNVPLQNYVNFSSPSTFRAAGNQGLTSQQTPLSQNGQGGMMQQNSSAVNPGNSSGSQQQSTNPWIFWCVDKSWSEHEITLVCPVPVDGKLCDDIEFSQHLLREYNKIRGFRGRWLSWKTCLEVKFIRFNRIWTSEDEINKVDECLPTLPEYKYTKNPAHSDLEHMGIAAKQIIRGMDGKRKHTRITTTLDMTPKKENGPLNFEGGSIGWGIHAIQGWSLIKATVWIGSLTIFGLVFVPFWLVFINKTDLQNAFIPSVFFFTMVGLFIGIPNILGRA